MGVGGVGGLLMIVDGRDGSETIGFGRLTEKRACACGVFPVLWL